MKRRIAYSLYKTGYTQFPATDYDPVTKAIVVDLPDQPRHRMPKEWTRSGNAYLTPGGCRITIWNTGLARNYLVEHGYCRISTRRSVTIRAGIDSFERMLEAVREFEGG